MQRLDHLPEHLGRAGKKGTVRIPGEACSCGLYAAKDATHLQSLGYAGETYRGWTSASR